RSERPDGRWIGPVRDGLDFDSHTGGTGDVQRRRSDFGQLAGGPPMHAKRLARSALFCAVAATALAISSCGGGRVKVYPVHGKVVDEKGKPAVGAIVMFHPVAPPGKNVEAVSGTVDESGEYRLTTYTNGDGAPAGEYVVTITWPEPRKSPFGPLP